MIFIKDFPGHQAERMKGEKESYVSLSFPGEHMVFFSPPCLDVSVGAVTSTVVHQSSSNNNNSNNNNQKSHSYTNLGINTKIK